MAPSAPKFQIKGGQRVARAAVDSDLGVSARRLVGKAERHGWVTVGVVSQGDAGVVLSVRGRRGGQRFVVLFVDGSYDGGWWWTRQHEAVVKGYREVESITKVNGYTYNVGKKLEHDETRDEVVTWTSERPAWRRLASLSELVGVASRNVAGLLASEVS